MVNAVSGQDVEKLGDGPASSHDAEQGQEQVPADQRSSHLEPRPGGHDLLTGEHQKEVEAARVEADGSPVGHHPCLGLGVLEVSLEVEDVRVVGSDQEVARHGQRVQGGHRFGGLWLLLNELSTRIFAGNGERTFLADASLFYHLTNDS